MPDQETTSIGRQADRAGSLHIEAQAVKLLLLFQILEIGGISEMALLHFGIANRSDGKRWRKARVVHHHCAAQAVDR
jgi:hypothetical protein